MDNRQKALEALIECPSITAAAATANLSRRTLYNFLGDAEFRATLKRQREAAAIERAERLSQARETALQAVVGLVNDTATPAAVRVLAAKALLSEASIADAKLDSLISSADFSEECF